MDNDIIKEVSKEIAKDVYEDAAKPAVKSTGQVLGLVPRAIRAALFPVEKWVLQKEYNLEETKKLLDEKLKNTPPELIQPPEPYIAVPALQYISYCMDNHELRNMYANLLANSMNAVVKKGVHPGFIEIIKQLSPDEAKILSYFSFNNLVPTISLRLKYDQKGYWTIMNNFSNIGELADCEKPFDIPAYFDNLIRLGLLESGSNWGSLTDKKQYEPLKNHSFIEKKVKSIVLQQGLTTSISEGFMRLTDYGKRFCDICLDNNRMLVFKKTNDSGSK